MPPWLTFANFCISSIGSEVQVGVPTLRSCLRCRERTWGLGSDISQLESLSRQPSPFFPGRAPDKTTGEPWFAWDGPGFKLKVWHRRNPFVLSKLGQVGRPSSRRSAEGWACSLTAARHAFPWTPNTQASARCAG